MKQHQPSTFVELLPVLLSPSFCHSVIELSRKMLVQNQNQEQAETGPFFPPANRTIQEEFEEKKERRNKKPSKRKYESDESEESTTKRSKNLSDTSKLRGESRLRITFENMGTLGNYVQRFGRSSMIIPDGLCGTFRFYNEFWRFEIIHLKEVLQVNPKWVRISWNVTNLTSNKTVSTVETDKEVFERSTQGRTISNQAFRNAMEQRALELEELLENETSNTRIDQLHLLIRNLRPRIFSDGPLVFGLQHKVIQDRMMKMVKEREEQKDLA